MRSAFLLSPTGHCSQSLSFIICTVKSVDVDVITIVTDRSRWWTTSILVIKRNLGLLDFSQYADSFVCSLLQIYRQVDSFHNCQSVLVNLLIIDTFCTVCVVFFISSDCLESFHQILPLFVLLFISLSSICFFLCSLSIFERLQLVAVLIICIVNVLCFCIGICRCLANSDHCSFFATLLTTVILLECVRCSFCQPLWLQPVTAASDCPYHLHRQKCWFQCYYNCGWSRWWWSDSRGEDWRRKNPGRSMD